ncbi:MAG TPA: TonB-dependent receptor [Steroidobacteraceae bacterium]|nr:TonB-dependent receptor [Steroidobacteraceae bacterium]
MNGSRRLSCAIAAILSGSGAGLAHAADAGAAVGSTADSGADMIQEITVTAQRRVENMQDVPISIQALTSETLTQLNVETFEDFVKYLPNVTSASTGPGQGAVYMRGLSTTLPGVQGSGGIGSFPNVAIYLDDQSGALPGRNLDVYAADLERIEVLEGPQGTLFGSGAEAGVLRYITNKPKIDVTEGNVDSAYEVTAHGDPSARVTAVLNLPVIADTLAVRGVIYSDSQGGYIDNVPGTFSRQDTDIGIHYANYPVGCTPNSISTGVFYGNCKVPPGSQSVNNFNLAQNNFNPVTYTGFRLSGLLKINEDWNALLTQSYQNMRSQGVFYEMPQASGSIVQPLPDLSVQTYEPAYDNDRFENTALTINGKIGVLKVVYTGGYLVRHIQQQNDYTAYARGVYADYYQCIPGAAATTTTPATVGKCYSPNGYWQDKETNDHDSQELRVSTPDEWRLRGIFGAFWEEYVIHENIDWFYKSVPPCTATSNVDCLTDVGPGVGAQVNNPNIRPDNESYFDDIIRTYRQQALFGSADFDIIPKVLTVTAGTRYYRINATEVGFSASSFGCFEDGPPPCTGNQPPPYGTEPAGDDFSNNETRENLNRVYSGFRSRVNLSWHVMPDVLVYYTWSQGFRPGGFNRGTTTRTPPGANYTYAEPELYQPDTLTNNEFGWKTQWFDHRLEWNAAIYQEDWKNTQIELFEPCCFGNLSFVTNGPNYRVRGTEQQVVVRVTHGLTVTGGMALNWSSLVSAPPLYGTNGQPITSIVNPFGAPGSPLAQSPPFEGNLRARYEFSFNEYNSFLQAGVTKQAHSYSSTSSIPAPDEPGYRYYEPGFWTFDASAGIARDKWNAQLYGQNLTDTRADLYENANQFVDAKTVNRPRTVGVRFGYKF